MRLVLDTNVAVSGLLWNGPPRTFMIEAAAGRLHLITSTPLLQELERVLKRPKFIRQIARQGIGESELLQGYAAAAEIVTPAVIAPTVLRDLDDDWVLATALAGRADLIVSGDKDLLDLGMFGTIPIVRSAEALSLVP